MDNFIVLVDRVSDWLPYYPTEQLVTVHDYLFEPKYQKELSYRIINLSKKTKYLSSGYYCSLVAEARSHKIMPTLKTISDLSKKKFYYNDLDELQTITNQMLSKYQGDKENVKVISFRIYFSHTTNEDFKDLAGEIFNYYPIPILEVRIVFDKVWSIGSLVPLGLSDLSEKEEAVFGEALEKYSTKIWRLPKELKSYIYDLAVLVDPSESLPPSDAKALEKFKLACEKKSIYCEFIRKKDLSRINEFDALFIRTTTSIDNYTYQFAKAAHTEGVVVIDDDVSILKCTNKIFISNLMDRIGLNNIPGMFVENFHIDTLKVLEEKLGYPMVVKIPDGSFSIGVSKVKNREELVEGLTKVLKKSDLILVQKFLYTSYDWRIGVLGGKALYACKYFMSKDHWQIYNHDKDKENHDFSGDFQTLHLDEVPTKVLNSAVKAASAIGNGLYGVDIKEDEKGKVYIVEINDNPNIDDGIEDLVLNEKLYDKLVSWFISQIETKVKRKKSEFTE